MAKLIRTDLYILGLTAVIFIISLLLPFETLYQPLQGYESEDFAHYADIPTFGYQLPLCYLQWAIAALLWLPGYSRRKISVIALTVFFTAFFVSAYGSSGWGMAFHPVFRSGFYLTVFGCMLIAAHAHWLAFRRRS